MNDETELRADTAPRATLLLWLAVAGVAAGTMLLVLGGGMFAATGRWRSVVLVVLPGIVLTIAGTVLMVLAKRQRSAAVTER